MRRASFHRLEVRRLLYVLKKEPLQHLHLAVPLELGVLKVRVLMVLTLLLWLFIILDCGRATLKLPKSLG